MKKLVLVILLFSFFQVSSQNKKKDTLFVLYQEDTELIKKITSKISNISGFRILLEKYKTKESREKRLQYLREHPVGEANFYIGFTGVKNFVLNDSLNKYELNTVDDISKRNIIMGYGQKVFFIEKLSCNKYLIHQTHLGYD
jgi:hypothetical protein